MRRRYGGNRGHLDARTHRDQDRQPHASTARRSPCPRARRSGQAAKDAGIEIPVLCHDERYDPVGVCRMCVVDVGARVYAAACVRPCEDGMEVKTATPELDRNRAQLTELLLVDQPPVEEDPKETTTADNELLVLVRQYGLEQEDVRAGARLGSRRGLLQPGHRRQPRRVHPLRPLRPRLRRHPGQRRHRPLGQGLLDPDRVRPQRPDGRVVVRDLRRMRRRVPDRRAHEQADQRRADPAALGAAAGRHGLPVLRRRLCADLQRRRRAQGDRLRRRPLRSPARSAACASRAATAGTTPSPSSA